MEPMMHGFAQLSASAAEALVASTWQGLVLVACVALVLRLLPRLTPAARSAVWLAVFLLVGGLGLVSMLDEGRIAAAPSGAVQLAPGWGFALAGMWFGLSLLRAGQLARAAVRLSRIARRAVPLKELDEHLAISGRRVALCASSEVTRPCVVGFFAPRILLPAGLVEKLSAAELQQVVLHEREHLRRRDDWVNLLQKIGLVLMPLNPVLLWVERRLCVERELACDDHVLRSTKAHKAYAACLANLAEHTVVGRRQVSLALGALERRSELAGRIYRILQKPEAGMGRGAARLATGALVAAVVAGGVGLARCPEVVSFRPEAVSLAASPGLAEPGPGAAHPVVFREKTDAPKMVNAVMREPMPARKLKAAAAPAKAQRITGLKRVAVRQRWVVMTTWSEDGSPSLVTLGFSEEVPAPHLISTYATVPTANGWLVIPL